MPDRLLVYEYLLFLQRLSRLLCVGLINIHFVDTIQHELYKNMTVEELRDYTIDQYKKILD